MSRLAEIAARAATLQARRDAGKATLICRDVPYLLARLAEAEARVALLEDLVRTYMSGDADQNTYRAARAALAAAPEAT